jgi:hypothetical protein
MTTSSDKLPKEARVLHDLYMNSLPFFSRKALKIKTKRGELAPFVFNKAQEYLHKRLEDQKKRTGKVRALILKGRQQGCSTYVGARYYHNATTTTGKSVFILSHEGETTNALFGMVDRYYQNVPELLKPEAEIANRRKFRFAGINAEYSIGTAGNEDVGRGTTIQLFHGSEVAAWSNTDEIETGILQAVPDMENTEIILESTARGMGNMFYDKCMDALEGKTDYEIVFIPWFWQEEYRRPVTDQLVLSEDDLVYKTTYGLDDEQMAWRSWKIADLKSPWKFKQEYPANIMEAFQTSGETFIAQQSIMAARKSGVKHPTAPLIIGLDPARFGDRTMFAFRRGRECSKFIRKKFDPAFKDTTAVADEIAGLAARLIEEHQPQKMFIDTGYGWDVVDRLRGLGYGEIVTPVNFGGEAQNQEMFLNKRAEMWWDMRNWLHGDDGPVSIPDDDNLHKDLSIMPPEKRTGTNRIQLVSKKELKKKYRFSPDCGDALALTFAFPVKQTNGEGGQRVRKKTVTKVTSPLSTLNRMRRYQGKH